MEKRLTHPLLPHTDHTTSIPLLEANEVSPMLGEQVRAAVELLLNALNQAIRSNPALLKSVRQSPRGTPLTERHVLEALYQAAVRVIMRVVIILFAEARDMLPRSEATYSMNYSIEELYKQLQSAEHNAEGRAVLEERHSAWTRLLSLFAMIYNGSSSLQKPVLAYNGLLFRPGEESHPDATLRAMALFESLEVKISDATVLQLLKYLKIGTIRVGRGRKSRMVSSPVDFFALHTEYIGLMYQGLLDFNLHMTNEAMVFLKLGQEPLLPLSLLENMSDVDVKVLLKQLGKEQSGSPVAAEGDEALADDEEQFATDAAVEKELDDWGEEEQGTNEGEMSTPTAAEQCRRHALMWAERAVEVAGLLNMKQPQNDENGALHIYKRKRKQRAQGLLGRVLDQQEFYLVRRGGTRKGSGTFYTRPQLSLPITQHTLEPLLYTNLEDGTRIPRRPEEILALKVCDPACGSASFLVAALQVITDALFQAMTYYTRIHDLGQEGTALAITLPTNDTRHAQPKEERLPVRPTHEHFEGMIKARLRRYVVEHCLYGVDLSPLAVELARMSLWIETLDRELPCTFLDHKIKVGNALVGGWLKTFREYPIMAWMRDGGDASHQNGVRYAAKEWSNAIHTMHNEVIKPALIRQIESSNPQLCLFRAEKQFTPERLPREFANELEQIHALSAERAGEREERYRDLQQSPAYQEMKQALDSWCSIWFWPADKLAHAPTPANFYALAPSTQAIVEELAEELHFFHWEIEFPDVFARSEHGFDAILANPPWETAKPSSKEFFSDYDLLYRTYGKQEALQKQNALFRQSTQIERDWLAYQAHFKSLGNWAKHAASPFGDPLLNPQEAYTLKAGKEGAKLHALWRKRREQYTSLANEAFPFAYQGSADLNTYKMFLEAAHHLVKEGGRLGILVPSGIYTDQGASTLRQLFLNHNRWLWLFGFINWKRIFDIHSAFKFVVLLLEKGGQTDKLRVAFNQVDMADLEHPEALMLDLPRTQIEQFSPHSLAIVESQTPRDLAILEKLYNHTVLLGDQCSQGWQLQYAAEFHMTNDSKLFPPRPQWEAQGYRADIYGRWIDEQGNVALPLYEGRMVGAFDPSEKGWVKGKGRAAEWQKIPFATKRIQSQYLMAGETYQKEERVLRGNKVGFMGIGSATNTRSMYATLIGDMPCGNAVPVVQAPTRSLADVLSLVVLLNSFVYDYALRCRLGGVNLNYFLLAETPLIPPARIRTTICAQLAARLNLIMPGFAPQWLEMRAVYPVLGQQHWRGLWAITEHERLRLRCILDALVAELYGLEYDDFAWIVRDDPNNPKGFWRVDKEKPHELRHTTLTLTAFKRLKEIGLVAFEQEDWQFPTEIGTQLGPRFTPWQIEGAIEESWAECEEHARRMQELSLPSLTKRPANSKKPELLVQLSLLELDGK